MVDPVNLRRARKAKARDVREQIATQNRISFGIPKALSTITQLEQKRADSRLDEARLDQKKTDEPD
jgi:Domain of unknown function (DUF4169)